MTPLPTDTPIPTPTDTPTPVPGSNLLAAFGFNEGVGIVAYDSSGNGRLATLASLPSTPLWSIGHSGYALQFDGSNDYAATVLSGYTLDKPVFTLSAWIKRNGVNKIVTIGKQTGDGTHGITIEAWNDGNIYCNVDNGIIAYGLFASNDSEWHHVACVFDGTQTGNTNRLKMYLDGVSQSPAYNGTIPDKTTTNTDPFYIGRVVTDYSQGEVDDLRFYLQTLTATEIQADMVKTAEESSSVTPTSSPTSTPTSTLTPTIFLTLTPTPTMRIGPITALAVLGDSFTDEYRADDNRGGTYAANTFNWLVANPDRNLVCAINLSGQSIGDEQFLHFVFNQFKGTGISPDKVCFEITETAAIANLSKATDFIEELKAIGCRFSLDDFGSGLSSFSYLKNLPVDYLKIDGIFVKDMVNNPIDCAMVEAINNIGQVMGIKTIAEYAENSETLHKLRSLGINYAQGYAIAKPAPLAQASFSLSKFSVSEISG